MTPEGAPDLVQSLGERRWRHVCVKESRRLPGGRLMVRWLRCMSGMGQVTAHGRAICSGVNEQLRALARAFPIA